VEGILSVELKALIKLEDVHLEVIDILEAVLAEFLSNGHFGG
jgi:hypothetical protein